MNKAQACGLQGVSVLEATYIQMGFVFSKPRLRKPDLQKACRIAARPDDASEVPVVSKGEFDRLQGRRASAS